MSGSKREDRLSSLPDETLVEILSYLPIKSAVVTGTLSHRWTNLWTQIKSIMIRGDDFKSMDLDMLTNDNLFKRLACPTFDKVVLNFKGTLDHHTFGLRGERFGDRLCDLNVREIHIFLRVFCSCPPSIFRMNSLVALHLDRIQLDNNIDCIDLPNLRRLSMHLKLVATSCCKVLEKIVRSCPNLEDLCVNIFLQFNVKLRKPIASRFHLSSQNLRVLNIQVEDVERSYAQFFTVIVEARKLESFRFYTPSGIHCYFAEDSVTLLEADISLDTKYDYGVSTTSFDDDYEVSEKMETVKLKLYRSISNVRILTLNSTQLSNTSTMFPNLTCLTLTYPRPDTWQNAIDLLVQCPFLRKLILQAHRPYYYNDAGEPWSPPKIIPACMTTHVKRIEIQIKIEVDSRFKYRVELSWLKLVRFLLSCATVLERLIITVIGGEHVRDIIQESDQVSLFKELYACHRISLCCQVEVYGILESEGGEERVWTVGDDGIISLDKSSK